MDSRCVQILDCDMPVTSSMSYDEVVNMLSLRNKKSRANYRMAISDFCSSCGVSVMSATSNDAKHYQNILSVRVEKGTMSLTSMNVRLYQLRSIYDHLGFPIFAFVTAPESAHKKGGVDILPSYFKDIRVNAPSMLYTIVRLAAECGLSVSEIGSLKVSSLSNVGPYIHINKYEGHRCIEIPLDLFVELKSLAGQSIDGEFIFFGEKGHPMSVRTLQRLLSKYSTYTFSELRNYALVNMINKGMDEKKWQAYTGMITHYSEFVSQIPYLMDSFFSYECALSS